MASADGGASTRRTFFRRTATGFAAAAGAVASLTGTPGWAWSAPAGLPNPPEIGMRYAFGFRAARTSLSVLSSSATVDFRGELAFEVTAHDPMEPWNVRMRITRFHATGFDDSGNGFGQVTMERSDSTAPPDSRLVIVSENPPRWRQVVSLDAAVTLENPPSVENPPSGAGHPSQGPLVLRTLHPAELVGNIASFPPQGEEYTLQQPIQLATQDGNSPAEISTFPAQVGSV